MSNMLQVYSTLTVPQDMVGMGGLFDRDVDKC